MTDVLMPDALVVAVAWAKANTAVAALFGTNVSTRIPSGDWSVWLRPGLITSSVEIAEGVAVIMAAVQWDSYARTTKKSPDLATASLGARTVATELAAVSDYTIAGKGTLASAGGFVGPLPGEEEEGSKLARFQLDSLLIVRP